MKQLYFLFLLLRFYSIIIMGDFMDQIFKTLTQLIKKYNTIILMTHKNPDFDGMGSAIALQQIIHSFKKESYICKNTKEVNKSLLKAYKYIENNNIYHQYVSKVKAEQLITEDTLLIILDTHKEKMTEEPSLLHKAKNIVVIDHHIKSKDYIKESILSYINANLSSTVEFVADYIKYLNKVVDPLVATFMLVGLEIDTNSFKLKTTDKTYETAAFLAKIGADNIIKQELLQETKNEYIKRQKLIEKSFMVDKNLAMCVADNKIYEAKDLASIAEELLQFENVEASFVIGKLSNTKIGISARSIGKIDVETIMSKLGGGGHLNEAATQLENSTLIEAEKQLLEVLGG